jgi:hypothetical protein
MTAKHHDGFCLFESRFTDYKATNTPAGRDLFKEYIEAFRAAGLRVGVYYSLLDWHHPDYTIDRNHPLKPATDKEYEVLNKGKNMDVYRKYIKDQVRELLTNYGKIDLLWLDYSFPSGNFGKGKKDWDSENLLLMTVSTFWMLKGARILLRLNSTKCRSGRKRMVSECHGKHVRPSQGHGDITATKTPGNQQSNCWFYLLRQ